MAAKLIRFLKIHLKLGKNDTYMHWCTANMYVTEVLARPVNFAKVFKVQRLVFNILVLLTDPDLT